MRSLTVTNASDTRTTAVIVVTTGFVTNSRNGRKQNDIFGDRQWDFGFGRLGK
jgi:hypothetical protein